MNNENVLKGIIAVVVLGVLVAGTIAVTGSNDQNQNQSSSPGQSSQMATSDQLPNTSNSSQLNEDLQSQATQYADGEYVAAASYAAPSGQEEISVEVLVSSNKISSVNVTPLTNNPTSRMYQEDFAEGISAVVEGIDLQNAEVDAVSGSSLTPRGFNNALEEIRDQARVQ